MSTPYSLCITGAGIAGLNALFVATRYLSCNDKVLLVDRNPRIGGMWNDTYDFVRLHQPHPYFTAGNIPWVGGRDPGYLANRTEVLAHFDHCLDVLRSRVDLEVRYGHEYRGHREVRSNGHHEVEIDLASTNGEPTTVQAKRCVKAFGHQIPINDPLPLSSGLVRSLSPNHDDLLGKEIADTDAPIYIVGGGKTGMDTAHALLRRFPEKDIRLVVGSGSIFVRRDFGFPRGLKRWWGGMLTLDLFLEMARQYDGDNEDQVLEQFRSKYCLSLNDQCRGFLFGLLSDAEHEVVANGAREVVMDYVEDVVDREGQPEMLLRSGKRQTVPEGSVFVNCTGYVLRRQRDYEPYLSEHRTVVSVQTRSAIHFLSTLSSYLLTHLHYLGQLHRLPLYEIDFDDLCAKARPTFPFVAMTQTVYNMLLILEAVPTRVMNECGLDMDRWYPFPRRLLTFLKLKRRSGRDLPHFQRSLDRIRDKYDVRCGPLPTLVK